MRPIVVACIALAVCASAAPAQSLQYRSAAGVEFRSHADTGAIARAQTALAADPGNAEKVLQLGLAQAAAQQYREAIATFTGGIKLAPKNPLLYRWRGHRYISIGEPDRALADLTRGNQLDSTNYDIYYHLGIAHFLRGEFAQASAAFTQAQHRAPNANEIAGSTDWLWMALSRAGRTADAQLALAAITDSLKITTATAYAQRLRLYRGLIRAEQVVTPADTAAVQLATLSFGVGNWYLVRGDTANARTWFQRAVASGGWPGFGFFAAQADLRRIR